MKYQLFKLRKECVMKTKEIWLTTKDNPFDFFEQFESWYKFDETKGYCTCGLIARVANLSEDLTDREEDDLTTLAINEIIEFDTLGIYKIISKEISA